MGDWICGSNFPHLIAITVILACLLDALLAMRLIELFIAVDTRRQAL